MIRDRKEILAEKVIIPGTADVETGDVDLHVTLDWIDTVVDALSEEPRKYGSWEWKSYTSFSDGIMRKEWGCFCGVCHKQVPPYHKKFRYCPYCGSDNKARMEKETNEAS